MLLHIHWVPFSTSYHSNTVKSESLLASNKMLENFCFEARFRLCWCAQQCAWIFASAKKMCQLKFLVFFRDNYQEIDWTADEDRSLVGLELISDPWFHSKDFIFTANCGATLTGGLRQTNEEKSRRTGEGNEHSMLSVFPAAVSGPSGSVTALDVAGLSKTRLEWLSDCFEPKRENIFLKNRKSPSFPVAPMLYRLFPYKSIF